MYIHCKNVHRHMTVFALLNRLPMYNFFLECTVLTKVVKSLATLNLGSECCGDTFWPLPLPIFYHLPFLSGVLHCTTFRSTLGGLSSRRRMAPASPAQRRNKTEPARLEVGSHSDITCLMGSRSTVLSGVSRGVPSLQLTVLYHDLNYINFNILF